MAYWIPRDKYNEAIKIVNDWKEQQTRFCNDPLFALEIIEQCRSLDRMREMRDAPIRPGDLGCSRLDLTPMANLRVLKVDDKNLNLVVEICNVTFRNHSLDDGEFTIRYAGFVKHEWDLPRLYRGIPIIR